jgi:aminoglycoside N3'-acetyltransferase
VHTSFRAVRPVEGGPLGLIEALRAAVGASGTLVMLSYTGDADAVFDPLTTPASADLGVVADTFWRLPGVRRSNHPEAFAAAGTLAAQIVEGPLPLPPHRYESPIGRVYDLDGQVLLLGVGHAANTSLHLAELLAHVPYRVPKHCTVLQDGRAVRIDYGENDHCCELFALADGWLRAAGLQSEARIGNAHARLFRARDAISIAVGRLKADPLVFLHAPEVGCEECDLARATCSGGWPGTG